MKIVINFLLRKSRKDDDGKIIRLCKKITYLGNRICKLPQKQYVLKVDKKV